MSVVVIKELLPPRADPAPPAAGTRPAAATRATKDSGRQDKRAASVVAAAPSKAQTQTLGEMLRESQSEVSATRPFRVSLGR